MGVLFASQITLTAVRKLDVRLLVDQENAARVSLPDGKPVDSSLYRLHNDARSLVPACPIP